MIGIMPATREHVEALYLEALPNTIRAVAAVESGRVLGVAGIYLDHGRQVAFAKLTDELRGNRRAVIRGAREAMKLFGTRVFAICDKDLPTAPGFLAHFGFQNYIGEVHIWQR